MLIQMNFVSDYELMLNEELTRLGVKDPDASPPWKRFAMLFDNSDRLVPAKKYKVHVSKELRAKADWQMPSAALLEVIKRLKSGKTIQPYLSTLTQKPEQLDRLLLHWDINHLHLEPMSSLQSNGFVKRADQLLLFRVKGDDCYLIDVLPHSLPTLWVEKSLVEIADRNWPHLHHANKSRTWTADQLTATQLALMRRKNINVPFVTARGMLSMPTSGVSSAGHSITSSTRWLQTQERLKHLERYVRSNHDVLLPKPVTYVTSIVLQQVHATGFTVFSYGSQASAFVDIADL